MHSKNATMSHGSTLFSSAMGIAEPIVVSIQVPAGCAGGSQVLVAHPETGAQMALIIPAGLQPGQTFQASFASSARTTVTPMAAPAMTTPTTSTTVAITAPLGGWPGQQLQITHPSSGAQYTVAVPEGVPPGTTFTVQLPNPAVRIVRGPTPLRGGSTPLAPESRLRGPSALHSTPAPLSGDHSSGRAIAEKLFGRIKLVDNFEDYRVKVVSGGFADLKVKRVDNFEQRAGRWKMVEGSFCDYKVKIVKRREDITIKYVTNFEGPSGR